MKDFANLEQEAAETQLRLAEIHAEKAAMLARLAQIGETKHFLATDLIDAIENERRQAAQQTPPEAQPAPPLISKKAANILTGVAALLGIATVYEAATQGHPSLPFLGMLAILLYGAWLVLKK